MKNSKTLWLIGAISSTLLVIALACGAEDEPTPAPTAKPLPAATFAPTPVPTRAAVVPTAVPTPTIAPPTLAEPAGTVVVGFGGWSFEVFDNALAGANGTSGYGSPMFDYFIYPDDEANLSKERGVLTDWEMSPDAKTWTLTLRSGMRWHDGQNVTIDDAKFTIERHTQSDAICTVCGVFQRNLESLEVVDNRVFKAHFKTPDLFVPRSLLVPLQTGLPIMPKHYWDKVGGSKGFNQKPLGSGPFKYVNHQIGQFVEFEAFTDYWNKSRIPGFKVLRQIIVPEVSSRLALVQSGNADMVQMAPSLVPEIKKAGLRIMAAEQTWNTYLSFSQGWDPTFISSKLEVRKAINLAIDRKAVAKVSYPSEEAGGPIDLLIPTTQEGYITDLTPYPYDPAESRRILKSAGLEDLEVTIYHYDFGGNSPEQLIMQEAAAGYLEQAGMKVKLFRQDYGTWLPIVQQGQLSHGPKEVVLHTYNWNVAATIDSNLRLLFVTRDVGGNIQAYPDPEKQLAKFYTDYIGTLDPVRRLETAQQMVRHMHEVYGYVPISYKNDVWAVGPRIAEWKPAKHSSIVKHFDTLKPAR